MIHKLGAIKMISEYVRIFILCFWWFLRRNSSPDVPQGPLFFLHNGIKYLHCRWFYHAMRSYMILCDPISPTLTRYHLGTHKNKINLAYRRCRTLVYHLNFNLWEPNLGTPTGYTILKNSFFLWKNLKSR